MKRTNRGLLVIILLTAIAGTAFTQDGEFDDFTAALTRTMERYNWDASETGVLIREMATYEWSKFEGADPEVIALALAYGKRRGLENPVERVQLALKIAESSREMADMGLSSRESARAIMNGMRESSLDDPDLVKQLRERVREELHDSEGEMVQNRIESRTGRPESRATDSWTPPAQDERPNGEREDIPGGQAQNQRQGENVGGQGGK